MCRQRRSFAQKFRSEARFIKAKLKELYPQENCEKYRCRNNKMINLQRRQREEKGDRCPKLQLKSVYCDVIRYQPIKINLREHFSKKQIEKILDDKSYFFGDQRKFHELTSPKKQIQSLSCSTYTPIKHESPLVFTRQNSQLKIQEKAIMAQSKRKEEQFISLCRSRQIMKKSLQKQQSLEQFKQKQEQAHKQFIRENSKKLADARSRIVSNDQTNSQLKELTNYEKRLQQICWSRHRQRSHD